MPLTTQDGTKLGQTIVTDVNANVAVPASKGRQISHEAAILFDKAIVARPLMVPQVCDIHVKNTEYAYRWVNRDGMGGRFYTQRRAQGFINATNDDVDVLSADVQTSDGEIKAGDLILMKIRADLYESALKWNMQKAETLTRARGIYLDGASSDVNSDATASRKTISAEPGNKSGQAPAFIPTNVDAIIDDSEKSGRAEETRAVVDELRSKGKK